ncbi:putative 3-dehydroshikimate [Phaeomoniella chlamydospora]|uniref:Putative 3-dehydroshikimate n=1 Tax=Phaeomoniella chlamydospora TaxID=158046 RepID=A0A0G2DY47_PHACM|nr:putative 3-dehydroshikimate [Phaeomoniella chlamydospora]
MTSQLDYDQIIKEIPVSYSVCSLGRPTDPLPKILKAIAGAGFTGIELSFPNLQEFAKTHLGRDIGATDYEALSIAAAEVKKMCDDLGLEIMLMQPFANFEGWERGSKESEDAFERAAGWINIMKAAGCDTLQVGSTDAPDVTSDKQQMARDLADLCELLADHGLRLAYENWCWATHAPTWSDVWDIVKRVEKPNIGLCLDTFQTAGGEFADPTTESGVIESKSLEEVKRDYRSSIAGMAKLPKDKIYLLQISDAYKPKKPIANKTNESGLRPRGQWSHDYRPMPYDGGYLPIEDVTRAVLETGFRGWFSIEIFDGGPDGKGKEYDLDEFAKKAMTNFKKLIKQSTK